MRNGWKQTALAAVLCLLVFMAACALAEGELPLTIEGADENGDFWIGNSIWIRIDATDAKELYLTEGPAGSENELALHTGVFETQWNRDDEYGWGARHENVFYLANCLVACDYTVYARAAYWDGEERPADESAITWKESQKYTFPLKSKGPVGPIEVDESTLLSAERGQLLDIPVTLGENADFLKGDVFSGDMTKNVAMGNGSEEGHMYIPTWDLPAGVYAVVLSSGAAAYETVTKPVPFTVTEQTPWQEPETPVWILNKDTAKVNEPVTVAVHVPGANSVNVQVNLNGSFADMRGGIGDTCCFTVEMTEPGDVTFLICTENMEYPEGYVHEGLKITE